MANSPLRFLPAGNATVTTVPSVITSTLILASNPNRLGAIIVNNSNSRLFIKYGATSVVDPPDFTERLSPQETHVVKGGYTGIIDGIWAPNISGSAEVTEITP